MKITAALFQSFLKRPLLNITLLAISIFIVLAHLAITHPAKAATDNCQSQNEDVKDAIDRINKCAIQKDIYDDKIFNINQISGTTDSLYNLLTGRSQLHPETNQITANAGAIAASGRIVALLYSAPPASGVQYFAREFHKLNPVQPSYAQAPPNLDSGIGFAALEPVQKIWSVFRNASYIAFVLIFIIIGFMVMFRAHISPQAVATIQDSIPRLVVALALVTFSYAIAGFMIDLMFLFLNITLNLLQSANLINTGADIIFKKSVFGVVFSSWSDIINAVADAIANIIKGVIHLGLLDQVISFFGGGIAGIIAGVAMLFIMFRIFIMLLMAYAMIILLTMFAPFFFLIQALPGNNGAKEWFKQMAANISVFPTVALMFIFAGILGGIKSLGAIGASPLSATNVGQFPLLSGDLQVQAVGQIIGFGFLLMAPEAANLVKNFIGAKGPQLGGAGAAALGASAGFLGNRVAQSSPAQALMAGRKAAGTRHAAELANLLPTPLRGTSRNLEVGAAGTIVEKPPGPSPRR